MTEDVGKMIMTSDEAYMEFSSKPLVKAVGGVDKASFVAGYETAISELRQALLKAEKST